MDLLARLHGNEFQLEEISRRVVFDLRAVIDLWTPGISYDNGDNREILGGVSRNSEQRSLLLRLVRVFRIIDDWRVKLPLVEEAEVKELYKEIRDLLF